MILPVSRCVSSLELSALRRYFLLCESLRGHRVLTGGQVVVSSNLATPTTLYTRIFKDVCIFLVQKLRAPWGTRATA